LLSNEEIETLNRFNSLLKRGSEDKENLSQNKGEKTQLQKKTPSWTLKPIIFNESFHYQDFPVMNDSLNESYHKTHLSLYSLSSK